MAASNNSIIYNIKINERNNTVSTYDIGADANHVRLTESIVIDGVTCDDAEAALNALNARTGGEDEITDFKSKTWTGSLTNFNGNYIWQDNNGNVYYSNPTGTNNAQYKLNKTTGEWTSVTWSGIGSTKINGGHIWTDGESTYYSYEDKQYVYLGNETWEDKTWYGDLATTYQGYFYGSHIWTDGDTIYYSDNPRPQFYLDKTTSTWERMTWDPSGSIPASNDGIWTDGVNTYNSAGSLQQILIKEDSKWIDYTWDGDFNLLYGQNIWTDGTDIYYSFQNDQYILNKATNTWEVKDWSLSNTNFQGSYIWSDGTNTYLSYTSTQYILYSASLKDMMIKGVSYVTAGQKAGTTLGVYATAEGSGTTASGPLSHAEGSSTASGVSSHAEGNGCEATQSGAHAEGSGTHATGSSAHAEGTGTTASNTSSHAEGTGTTASDANAHAEGNNTTASKPNAHAEGYSTAASNTNAHAEGSSTTASGSNAHAEGYSTIASHENSHAEGTGTKTGATNQHVSGKYNVGKSTTLFEIGNGTGTSARSNALELDTNGNLAIAGNITCGGVTGSFIKKAEFNFNNAGGSESSTKDMILALGDFLTELEYNIDSSHVLGAKKGQILWIEIADYMDDYYNHNNNSVYWYQNFNPNVYYDRTTIEYDIIDAKYKKYGRINTAIPEQLVNFESFLPMALYDGGYNYPLYITLTLPYRVRLSNGSVYTSGIDDIYTNSNFIRFNHYMCYKISDSTYSDIPTGNYITYSDIGSESLLNKLTVYYMDI